MEDKGFVMEDVKTPANVNANTGDVKTLTFAIRNFPTTEMAISNLANLTEVELVINVGTQFINSVYNELLAEEAQKQIDAKSENVDELKKEVEARTKRKEGFADLARVFTHEYLRKAIAQIEAENKTKDASKAE